MNYSPKCKYKFMGRNVPEDFFFFFFWHCIPWQGWERRISTLTFSVFFPLIGQVSILCLENPSFTLGSVFISILSPITLGLVSVIRVQTFILTQALNPQGLTQPVRTVQALGLNDPMDFFSFLLLFFVWFLSSSLNCSLTSS